MSNHQLEHSDHQKTGQRFPLCFLANDINDPANIGSFFRIADALGVEKIWLTGSSPIPPNRKIKKTARSADKYVAFEYQQDPLTVISHLKSAGYTIASLEITSASQPLSTFDTSAVKKLCLILGSENSGIDQKLLSASDITLHIPMMGNNSSMNVANACAIAAYDIIRKMQDQK